MLNRGRKYGGFTLIELMITVGILGLLTTIAIPAFMRFQLRAKSAEAKANLAAIRVAEESYFGSFGLYSSALPAVPSTVGPTKTDWPLPPSSTHGFNVLGFRPEGNVYYMYAVTTNGLDAYTAEARSDIDGDSVMSNFGYVKAPEGTALGVDGSLGACEATGVYNPASGVNDRLEVVGACDSQSGSSVF